MNVAAQQFLLLLGGVEGQRVVFEAGQGRPRLRALGLRDLAAVRERRHRRRRNRNPRRRAEHVAVDVDRATRDAPLLQHAGGRRQSGRGRLVGEHLARPERAAAEPGGADGARPQRERLSA